MFALVLCVALVVPGCASELPRAAVRQAPVRREGLKTRHVDARPYHLLNVPLKAEEDVSDSAHCVVWGEFPFIEGMHFRSKTEAEAQFDISKHTDMVALHFDNEMNVMHRYVSPRLKHVNEQRMVDWCKKTKSGSLATSPQGGHRSDVVPVSFAEKHSREENLATPSKDTDDLAFSSWHGAPLPMQPNDNPSVTPSAADSIEAPVPASVTHSTGARDLGHTESIDLSSKADSAVPVSATHSTDAHDLWNTENIGISLNADSGVPAPGTRSTSAQYTQFAPQGKTLTETVTSLEQALDAIRAESFQLLKKVGVDEVKVASILQKPHAKAITNDAKLSVRVDTLEEVLPEIHAATAVLEEELLGTPKEMRNVQQPVKLSLKKKVDQLVLSTDALKKRLFDLQVEPFLADVEQMEETAKEHTPQVIDLAKNVGLPPLDSTVSVAGQGAHLKKRVNALERYASEANRHMNALEVELLENKGSTASLLQTGTKQVCMQDRIRLLKKQFENLKIRHAALINVPLQKKLDSIATGMYQLSVSINKMVATTGVDLQGPTTRTLDSESTIIEQVSALESAAFDLHRKVHTLEEEVAGTGSALTVDPSKAQSVSAKVKALETMQQSLASRAEALKSKV